MDTLKIQNRLSSLHCPICQQSRFFIAPQSASGYTETLYKARCGHCAYTFPVSIPTRPVKETDPDVHQWLGSLNCPACQESGAEMDFRCMPSVREAVYFVTCKACRHPFHEKAPMEAYE